MTTFDPRTTLARPDLAADSLRGQVTASHYTSGQRLTVIRSTASLFSEPRADGAMQTELLFGETITVLEQSPEGWSWGQSDPDHYVGYLPSDALSVQAHQPTHRVTSLRSFVYASASIKLVPLTALSFGSRVCVIGTHNQFSLLADGGFIISAHLSPLDETCVDPARFAALFLHTPYLWGGRSSLGLDCSGLVQLAFQACGIACPRDSDMQERDLGHLVPDLQTLRRNDLVFWKGHVGLMWDETTLLHASGHHMSVLKEPLVEARDRILAKTGHDITLCKRAV
jgi:cell wall-associated NlpC family hydrolase